MFSIGQEGQYLMGAVMAAYLGYAIHLPYVIHPLVIILASMAAGAFYSWIPGILKVKLGVNELLATIMMNAIATTFTEFMVQYPMRGDRGTTAHSPVIDATAFLPSFFQGSRWGVGFIIAVLAVIVAVVESTNAKLRLFRVPELLGGSFVLALLAVTSSFLLK